MGSLLGTTQDQEDQPRQVTSIKAQFWKIPLQVLLEATSAPLETPWFSCPARVPLRQHQRSVAKRTGRPFPRRDCLSSGQPSPASHKMLQCCINPPIYLRHLLEQPIPVILGRNWGHPPPTDLQAVFSTEVLLKEGRREQNDVGVEYFLHRSSLSMVTVFDNPCRVHSISSQLRKSPSLSPHSDPKVFSSISSFDRILP